MTDSSSAPSSGRGFGTRAVTAMFDSRDAADAAVTSLLQSGFRQDDVRLVPGYEKDRDATTARTDETGGFWSSLSDFFFPDEDRHVYAEGLSRGSFLVSVNTSEENHNRAVDILDDEGTIDLDEREDNWRNQGWSGYAGASAGRGTAATGLSTGQGSASPAGLGSGGDMNRSASSSPLEGSGMTGTTGFADGSRNLGSGAGMSGGAPGDARDRLDSPGDAGGDLLGSDAQDKTDLSRAASTSGAGLGGGTRNPSFAGRGEDVARRGEGDDVIPLAEENLRVGTREVEGGRVRVRSYVVERPVEEQVMLRREHVDVQRRPVDRSVAAGEDPFRERTVELDERRQEPVVSKETRIREEVSLRKDVENEQRTVSDTVRRTEVEVDDQRAKDLGTERRRS